MRPSRAGLLLVILCFCVPLFVGLGRADLRGDEAGHSFSVDRILETGDWLVPKASPQENQEFLEKPPLKFWIVALPIRLGVLPHDEFGLRFWDALFGSLAFLYVYAIGRRLAGPVCGVAAVLVLFAFYPLVFDHGLRTNNMEAPLLLCYCGGMYHFMAAAEHERPAGHIVAVALYFVLGFMTKFVAAIFLPFVLLMATLLLAPYRAAIGRQWRTWLAACALAVALIAPWFVYATVRFGREVWVVMLGQHVIARMTTALAAEQIQPWPFYWVSLYKTLSYAGALALVALGFASLAAQAYRRRWADAGLLLLWAIVPLALISLGTSKLIHYMYPFVPPFALAGGYLAALVVMLAPAPLERVGWPRALMAAASIVLAIVAAATAAFGELRLPVAGYTVVRSASIFRPAVGAIVTGALALSTRRSLRLAAVGLACFLLPVPAYAQNLLRLNAGRSPLRDMRDCLTRLELEADTPPGMYVDIADADMPHQTYYYMRTVRPWTRADPAVPVNLRAVSDAISAGRPLLFSDARFRALVSAWHSGEATASRPLPPVFHIEATTFLLPGAYAACHPSSGGNR